MFGSKRFNLSSQSTIGEAIWFEHNTIRRHIHVRNIANGCRLHPKLRSLIQPPLPDIRGCPQQSLSAHSPRMCCWFVGSVFTWGWVGTNGPEETEPRLRLLRGLGGASSRCRTGKWSPLECEGGAGHSRSGAKLGGGGVRSAPYYLLAISSSLHAS